MIAIKDDTKPGTVVATFTGRQETLVACENKRYTVYCPELDVYVDLFNLDLFEQHYQIKITPTKKLK